MEQKQVLKKTRFRRQAQVLDLHCGCAQLYGSARRETLFIRTKADAGCKQQKKEMLPLGRLRLSYAKPRVLSRAEIKTHSCTISQGGQTLVYRVESTEMFRVFIGADSPHQAKLVLDDGLNLGGTISQTNGETGFCLRVQVATDGTVAHSQTRILIKRASYVTLFITGVLDANNGWEAAYAQCKSILTDGKNG